MTRIVLHIMSQDGTGSKAFEVDEDFDAVLEKVAPIQPATSALEHREKITYTKTDGGRLMVAPSTVAWAEEVVE